MSIALGKMQVLFDMHVPDTKSIQILKDLLAESSELPYRLTHIYGVRSFRIRSNENNASIENIFVIVIKIIYVIM